MTTPNLQPRSRTVQALLVVALILGATASASLQTQTETMAGGKVRLLQEFGRWFYGRCELDVSLGERMVTLLCAHSRIRPPQTEMSTVRTLSRDEAQALADLLDSSDLYAGGNIGIDSTPAHGTLEIVAVNCCGRKDVVALVASGNVTFNQSGPRRDLLALLHKWHRELLMRGLAKPAQ